MQRILHSQQHYLRYPYHAVTWYAYLYLIDMVSNSGLDPTRICTNLLSTCIDRELNISQGNV